MDDKKITQDFVEFHKENRLCTAVERGGVMCFGKICSFGYCKKHYQRFNRHNDVNLPTKQIEKCRFIDCENKYLAKGYCRSHYRKYVTKINNQKKACSAENCKNKRNGDSMYCGMHHARIYIHGSFEGSGIKQGAGYHFKKNNCIAKDRKVYRKCIVPLCDRDSNKGKITKGLCTIHYQRWWKYGDYNKTLINRKSK